MKILLTDNIHLYKTPDGKYYTPSIYNQSFFQKYLNVFENVRIIAKTKYVNELSIENAILVNFNNVEIYELPWYQGFSNLIIILPKLIKRVRKCFDGCDCAIFRVAQIESFIVYIFGKRKKNYPYAIELVNDPRSFSDLSYIFRVVASKLLKKIMKGAVGASYVTKYYLQRCYPLDNASKFEANYSSIDLKDSDIGTFKSLENVQNIKLIHISNFISGDSKGHLTVLYVAHRLIKLGYKITVEFVGDGPDVKKLIEKAEHLGISNNIVFCGRISNRELYINKIRECNILIFPSLYEGLPRVVIEAMANGLPCVASPVGGIPELIDKQLQIDANDVEGYVNAIKLLIDNKAYYKSISEKNLSVAQQYHINIIENNRNNFYNKLKLFADKNSSKNNTNLQY